MAKASKKYNVAVVGATGAVGTEMLRVLAQRRFPLKALRLLASVRSKGSHLAFNGSSHKVEVLTKKSFDGIDVALFSAGASRSLEFGPEAVKRGAMVVDNSSAFRMDKATPLVVPEVNPQALEHHKGLIANPNCSTIIMLVPLAPIHRAAGVKRNVASTYQSVSGAGAKAMAQLYEETAKALRQFKIGRGAAGIKARIGAKGYRPAPLPRQIAFNVIPQVDVFLENRYTKEEMKIVHETRKILGAPQMPVSSTCVRVPVFLAHSTAVWIETERPVSVQEAQALLRHAPGVKLVDDSAKGIYPTPLDAASQDDVLVGRIRKDESIQNGLVFWATGDNLRKGAATNAVQIAELLIKR